MNIAIIIGVSKYQDSRNDLPGCFKDTSLINSIITKTEKFDSVLLINKNEESAIVKSNLANFITEHKGNVIDEIFFYYTGHGEFHNDEFYFLLSDFDQLKRKQTSLQNTEIDTFLRSLSPTIVIKVIDACQSGTNYIKENEVITKYFDSSKQTFNKCYFLNSSLNSQSSFQNDEISFFTNSFIKSISNHKTNEIRYKDIIDFISDDFENNKYQNPYFVIQAELTEKFCLINPELKSFLKSISNDKKNEEVISLSMLDKIKLEAKEYITKEEVISILDDIKNEIQNFSLSSDLLDLYEINSSPLTDTRTVVQGFVIGKWLDENRDIFFAKARSSGVFAGKKHITGYELEIEVPYIGFSINTIAKYPNINSYNNTIVFLISKKTIRLFYFVTSFIDNNWDNKVLNQKEIEWKSIEFKATAKEDIISGINSIVQELISMISLELKEKYK